MFNTKKLKITGLILLAFPTFPLNSIYAQEVVRFDKSTLLDKKIELISASVVAKVIRVTFSVSICNTLAYS